MKTRRRVKLKYNIRLRGATNLLESRKATTGGIVWRLVNPINVFEGLKET